MSKIDLLIQPDYDIVTYADFCDNPDYDSVKVILFDSDEEFEDFCVAPLTKDNVCGDYSETYKKCLDAGMKFVIRSKTSNVWKHRAVVNHVPVPQDSGIRRRDVLVQLPVDNVVDVSMYWRRRFLIGSNVYNRKSIVSRVVYDLVRQGKTPEQVCEIFKSCCDSMVTSEAFNEFSDEDKTRYNYTTINNVDYYYKRVKFSQFIKTAAEYGIIIEDIEK